MTVYYQESWELLKLAKSLMENYEFYLNHVDLEEIHFVEKIGKKPKKAPPVSLFGLSGSSLKELMQTQVKKSYALEAWKDEFDELHQIEKQWLVFNELLRVHKNRGGKLRKPDITEFGFVTELLGPYWRRHPENLPDMLSGTPVAIPLPPDDEDTGDSTIEE